MSADFHEVVSGCHAASLECLAPRKCLEDGLVQLQDWKFLHPIRGEAKRNGQFIAHHSVMPHASLFRNTEKRLETKLCFSRHFRLFLINRCMPIVSLLETRDASVGKITGDPAVLAKPEKH